MIRSRLTLPAARQVKLRWNNPTGLDTSLPGRFVVSALGSPLRASRFTQKIPVWRATRGRRTGDRGRVHRRARGRSQASRRARSRLRQRSHRSIVACSAVRPIRRPRSSLSRVHRFLDHSSNLSCAIRRHSAKSRLQPLPRPRLDCQESAAADRRARRNAPRRYPRGRRRARRSGLTNIYPHRAGEGALGPQ